MYLYRNAQGYEVRGHSHSGGNEWSCPKRYYWKRLQGWQSREEGVALTFGHAVEAAVQYYHLKGFESGSGVDEFKKLWFAEKNNQEISYSEKSGDWDDHYRMGVEFLKLYEVTLPDLPVSNAKFQLDYKVPLFPEGNPYHGIFYRAIIDMLCVAPNNHPLLPANGETGETREFVVDIKTSSNSYYTDPRLSSLDDQLRDYSWVTDCNTVAFLVFVKNHSEMGSGEWVTVLEGPKVGKKYQVFDVSDERILVLPKDAYDEYAGRKKAIKGKGAKEAQEALLSEYFYRGHSFKREQLTKQKIQFLPAVIPNEDSLEARREAIHEAMDIADHGKDNYYPKRPGVRFPHNICTMCDCLGLCIGDEAMVKEKLVQIDGVF